MRNQWRNNIFNGLILSVLILGSSFAWAGTINPNCAYKPIDINKYGGQPFQNPPGISAQNGRLDTTFNVQFTDPKTTSMAGCPVKLRTYNGQLVGPTLRVKQGDVINLALKNKLPKESPNEIQAQFDQENKNAYLDTIPASFNTTNMHYHGLHVSPTGNSDNVLLDIPPQTELLYEVKLPQTHPIGSYWYHAHAHGSTSIQVGSGMAGALIIEDDPKNTP
ncbi:MAG: multicopper oxidase domain-containing protein, partial [Pseudomonadota bacterium]